MHLWKIATAHLVILSLIGCTSTARMTPLDRSLVNKKITPTSTGGFTIDMDGNFLLNPTAAVETFHTFAEKQMGGRPYRYTYAIDKKQTTRRVYESGDKATPGDGSRAVSSGNYYTPIYLAPSSGGSGEAAIILGSIALIILIAKMASDSRREKATAPPAVSTEPAKPDLIARDETVTTRILRVTGNAEPVAPVALDRNRTVEVMVPDQAPVVGRLKPDVARAISEQVSQAFQKLGCKTSVGSLPAQGYRVSTAVLRAQGTVLTYSSLTLEITLTDESTNRELARWVVQANEKPFDLKSQNERQYGPGLATSLLQKPLQTQVSRYLR